MNDLAPSSDWRDICQSLWGDDWMQPASDVIGVNRRTVERWRAGHQTVPPAVIAALLSIPMDVGEPVIRAYGRILRQVALNGSLSSIAAYIEVQRHAFGLVSRDLAEGRLATFGIDMKGTDP